MTDRDTITLPREVVQEALEALEFAERNHDGEQSLYTQEITALRAHLAAPRLEVTVDPRLTAEEAAAISAAIDARKKEQSEDIEALRREAERYRWLRDWLDNNGLLVRAIRGESLAGYEHPDIEALRRDAERYRWMKQEVKRIPPSWGLIGWDAAIDAAMGDKR